MAASQARNPTRRHLPCTGRTAGGRRTAVEQPETDGTLTVQEGTRPSENAGGRSHFRTHRALPPAGTNRLRSARTKACRSLGRQRHLRPDAATQRRRTWQGIVPPRRRQHRHMLMNYETPEQPGTHIALSVRRRLGGLTGNTCPKKKPTATHGRSVSTLAQTATAEELVSLDAHHLLYRLFHETPPRVFRPEQIEFSSPVRAERVSDMLLMLGAAEVGGVVAEQRHRSGIATSAAPNMCSTKPTSTPCSAQTSSTPRGRNPPRAITSAPSSV